MIGSGLFIVRIVVLFAQVVERKRYAIGSVILA